MRSDIVKRTKFTQPQVELSLVERQRNIQDAFSARMVTGKYLLIDDVVTSGITLNEIAKLLKRSGASEVWGATVARG